MFVNFLFWAELARAVFGLSNRSMNPGSCFCARETVAPVNQIPRTRTVRTSANVPKRALSCKENCPWNGLPAERPEQDAGPRRGGDRAAQDVAGRDLMTV